MKICISRCGFGSGDQNSWIRDAALEVAWFTAVKAQFQLRRVWAQEEKFCHVTAALDKMSLKKVVHLVVTPDPLQLYNKLKEALLASHQLTDFQRVELLHTMELLGGRKQSELLVNMWELCPANQHENIFFAMLFLQRLPRDIRCCSLTRITATYASWRLKWTSWLLSVVVHTPFLPPQLLQILRTAWWPPYRARASTTSISATTSSRRSCHRRCRRSWARRSIDSSGNAG